jgi:hypothetical protein
MLKENQILYHSGNEEKLYTFDRIRQWILTYVQ